MNDLDIRFEAVSTIKVMSTIVLHSTLNISKTVRVEAWFQRTTNRKWHMDYQMVT